ncbi:MAG: hypothetical protein HW409_1397 [candidate division NC10 bacterium]|nr:hypothetical protein [candidate division NC10 bacterium]
MLRPGDRSGMAIQQAKFRQAALSYLIYGCLYLITARPMTSRSGLIWFIVGAALIVLFPWLINKGYVWFTRILVLLVLFRAIGVARVIIRPTIAAVPLPGGIELPMRLGAFFFLLVTLGAGYMLARAAWDLSP